MSDTKARTLGEAFPDEQQRVREVLKLYQELGPVGRIGAMLIEQTLARAERAAMSGDVIEILKAYEELKGIEA